MINVKPEDRRLLVLETTGGLCVGALLAACFAALAVPRHESLLIPQDLARSILAAERWRALAEPPVFWLILALALAGHAVSWAEIAGRLERPVASLWGRSLLRLSAWGLALAGLALIFASCFFNFGMAGDIMYDVGVNVQGAALGAAAFAAAWLALARSWKAACWGAAYGGAVFVGLLAFGVLFRLITALVTEAWTPPMKTTQEGLLTLMAALGALSAGFFACLGTAAPAFRSDAPRRDCVRPAALIAMAFASSWLGLRLLAGRYDWRAPSLIEAAGLSTERPAPMSQITLGFEKSPTVAVNAWPQTARTMQSFSFPAEEVPAAQENAARLLSFLESGRPGRFRGAAWDALSQVHAALWDLEGERSLYDRLAFDPAAPLSAHADMVEWLEEAAPLREENRARLARICDDRSYYLGGRWPARCAEVRQRLESPARGRVRGKLVLKGAARLRVGLFALTKDRPEPDPPIPGPFHSHLVAAVWTQGHGTFEFADLAQGRYFLSVLAPAGALRRPDRLHARNHPGIIAIGRAGWNKELGTIRLDPS